ncbi:hypothetical protein TIFTF001_015363 [Ficus carica]|uniref:Uncharacterized protein n=1 Tax=Ficus carica TaxID=3494 RepID=A0AA88DIM4_FICCA|nr:hypothetical protein TIFTF001_015363 [Ficus carica]
MRQLLSDVDLDTINEGQIQSHFDKFLWDGLKYVFLTYEFKSQNDEHLKRERGEKLLDIERKFEDVKASATELIAELQTVTQSTKEGTDMMKVMVDRATLKAQYYLLKEYKQGLLVDADVEEEIELYEDSLAEVGGSSSAPVDVAAPTSNKPEPIDVEPLTMLNLQQTARRPC